MSDSTIPTPKASRRVLVPAAVAVCIAGGAFFGIGSLAAGQTTEAAAAPEPTATVATPMPASESTPTVDTPEPAATASDPEPVAPVATPEPAATVSAPEPVVERAARTERTGAVASATEYTLADAAADDDPRVADIECLYLSQEEDDAFVRVSNFRADRDRFFDIDSAVVQESRIDGLSFAEIAAEHGFSESDVGDGAAAMHGYCYQQLIGEGLTQQAAETRFGRTIARFTELMDAEPDASGRGAAGNGITNVGRPDR